MKEMQIRIDPCPNKGRPPNNQGYYTSCLYPFSYVDPEGRSMSVYNGQITDKIPLDVLHDQLVAGNVIWNGSTTDIAMSMFLCQTYLNISNYNVQPWTIDQLVDIGLVDKHTASSSLLVDITYVYNTYAIDGFTDLTADSTLADWIQRVQRLTPKEEKTNKKKS